MATSPRTRGDRGAASIRLVGLLLPAVLVAAGGGFALQRAVADDGPADPRPADEPPAGARTEVERRANRFAAPVYDCPEAPTVSDVHDGDRVFATGRHEELDGWLLIRNPLDPAEQWWIEAQYVTPDGSTSELPELGCDDPAPPSNGDEVTANTDGSTTTTKPGAQRNDGSAPTTEPGEVTTTAAQSPTATTPGPSTTTTTTITPRRTTTTTSAAAPPKPQPQPEPATTTTTTTTQPEPTTTTTRPDTTPPSLTVSRSPDAIWEQSPGLCGDRPRQATISASASDPSGVGSVRATWSVGNHHEDRDLASGSTVLGPYPYPTIPEGPPVPVSVTVTATDSRGNAASKTVTVMLHSSSECFG